MCPALPLPEKIWSFPPNCPCRRGERPKARVAFAFGTREPTIPRISRADFVVVRQTEAVPYLCCTERSGTLFVFPSMAKPARFGLTPLPDVGSARRLARGTKNLHSGADMPFDPVTPAGRKGPHFTRPGPATFHRGGPAPSEPLSARPEQLRNQALAGSSRHVHRARQ